MMMRFLFFLLLINISFSQKKPNIVLIMADDLGYESISVNGGKSYLTPNIDLLAKKGVRFINCHSEPICTPSRYSDTIGASVPLSDVKIIMVSSNNFKSFKLL